MIGAEEKISYFGDPPTKDTLRKPRSLYRCQPLTASRPPPPAPSVLEKEETCDARAGQVAARSRNRFTAAPQSGRGRSPCLAAARWRGAGAGLPTRCAASTDRRSGFRILRPLPDRNIRCGTRLPTGGDRTRCTACVQVRHSPAVTSAARHARAISTSSPPPTKRSQRRSPDLIQASSRPSNL